MSAFSALKHATLTRPLPANATGLIAFSLLVLFLNRGVLFLRIDGTYMQILVQNQFQWMPVALDFGPNPLQGMWNVFLGYNMNLIPAFAIQMHLFGGIEPVVTYTIFALELAVATYLIGDLLALPRIVSITAAWLLPLLALPFIWPPIFYPLYVMIPQCADLILGEAVLLWAFVRISDRSLRINLIHGAIIVFVVGWLVVANPLLIVTIVPTVAAGYFAVLASSRTRRVVLWRLALIAALLVAMSAGGFIEFLIGQTFYSVPAFFSDELWPHSKPDLTVASVAFQWHAYTGFGLGLVLLSLFGAIITVVRKTDLPRNLAIMHVVLTMLCVVGGYILVRYLPGWRGPSMLYFEVSIWPFYCLFAVHAVMLAFPWFTQSANKIRLNFETATLELSSAKAFTAAAALPLVFVAGVAVKRHNSMPKPAVISETNVVKLLHSEIALEPGSIFRGRVATFAGGDPARPITWLDQYGYDIKLWGITGNDHRSVGLWKYGIPTLFEYNHYITPPEYLLLSRTLARPIDRQLRNITTLTLPDPSVLQALGVRFVISDRSLGDDFQLREALRGDAGVDVRLYELSKPNLGSYSPTSLVLAKNASDAMTILKSGFDFSHSAIVTEPLTGSLVPVLSAELRFEKMAFNLHAKSEGRSLLALPIEFSRCLELSSVRPVNGDVQLLRINLVQLGVFFSTELDARVTFRSGPLGHTRCRLQDIWDVRALELADAAKRFPLVSQIDE